MRNTSINMLIAAILALGLLVSSPMAGAIDGKLYSQNQQANEQTTTYQRFLLPPGETISNIRLLSLDKAESVQFVSSIETHLKGGPPCPECDSAVVLLGVQIFRGHRIAEVILSPNCRDRITGQQFRCLSAEYELELTGNTEEADAQPWHDKWTLGMLSEMVDNPQDVPEVATARTRPQTSLADDTVSYLIITSDEMKTAFEEYAVFKTSLGNTTVIKTITEIDTEYLGDSVQMKVRDCIKDFHNTKHTQWVLLGGDIDVIPPIYCFSAQHNILTDLYYSNLDGDWNKDGDTLFGEPVGWGDEVDYLPEVFVGRIPCSTPVQAEAIINKLIAYQTNNAEYAYQTEALMFGTNILYGDETSGSLETMDGYSALSSLEGLLPYDYATEMLYQEPSSAIRSSLSSGYGLIVNVSQARGADHFLTNWEESTPLEDALHFYFFRDNMANNGKYGLFCNYTCFNNNLAEPNAVSRAFMQKAEGGGVAYIGSTTYDWTTVSYRDFHEEMFNRMFSQGTTEIGKALAEAKALLEPEDDWDVGNRQAAMFSFLYLGDPQLRIWTRQPQFLDVDYPETLPSNTQAVEVRVTSDGSPVEQALVCLSSPSGILYLGETDSDGLASMDLSGVGSLTGSRLAVSKQDYFVSEHQVQWSCCGRYVDPPGYTGNVNCSEDGKVTLGDITLLIDYVYISGNPLCCPESANANGDAEGNLTLSDITRLIDAVYISHEPTASCL